MTLSRVPWKTPKTERWSTRSVLKTPEDLYARLMERAEVLPNGCWRYTGRCNLRDGYGMMDVPRLLIENSPIKFKRMEYAHRISFAMRHGRLPWPKMHVDHLCRNRWCVNPDHLEEVTHRTNNLRGAAPAAEAWRTNTCKRGHSLSDAYRDSKGRRACRICTCNAARNRSLVIKRAAGRCERCGIDIIGRHSLHHRRPRAMGGSTLPDTDSVCNLLLLCGTGTTGCHGWVESYRTEAFNQGFLVSQFDDPASVPMLLNLSDSVYLTSNGKYRLVTA